MMRLFFVFLAVLVSASAVLAEASHPFDRSAPLEITSDRLEADDNLGRVVFVGHVVARQDTLTIHCGRLTVQYDESRQVRRVVADQDVRILHGDRVATSEQAVYDRLAGRVILTGNPRVNQGLDFVSGDRITVDLDGGRSQVDGGPGGKVKALFHPGEKADGTNPAR